MSETNTPKIEPLTSSNYATWSVRMRALLEHKDLWEVVQVDPPREPDAVWVRKNRQARSLQILNVSDQLLVTVAATETAKALWDAFHATYRARSTARRQ